MKYQRRFKCRECSTDFDEGEILLARNPFDETEMITGCPKCKAPDSFELLCDVEGCKRPATCGTPTEQGYRQTCGLHLPERNG